MDGKIEQHVCIKFCMKLSKSTTETLEMLYESFEEHCFQLNSSFSMALTFQGWSCVSSS
jgi:hypothetical protein